MFYEIDGLLMSSIMGSTTTWQGQIDLKFRRDGEKTLLQKSYARAPLKIQRPFYPESNLCHTVILHSAGGMVGGDRLSYKIHLAPASEALITTAAAAKIYRSAGEFAQQQIAIQLDRDAYLEWLPQDTIIFNSALYAQKLRVDLAEGAIFCAWEIVRLGRSARSESFTEGCWQTALEVWKNGQPLWIDRQQITGDQWKSLQAAAGQPILGLLVWLGESVGAEVVARIRALESQPEPKSGASFGVSAIAGGLVCRYRGEDRQAVQRWFIEIWTLLRQHSRGRSACIPRVWQL
jgi:urease accessory protein